MDTAPTPQESPFAEDSIEDQVEELPDDEIIEDDVEDEVDDEFIEEDEEESAEDDESDDDLSDEEIDALLESLDDEEEGDDEGDDEVDTVPHAALHKERERRKAVQAELANNRAEIESATQLSDEYKEALDDVERQLKELDLDDTIKVKKPREASSDEIKMRQQLDAQKQQEQIASLVGDMREEAAAHLDEFPQINGEDPEQAELILGFALASTLVGGDMEDAVVKGMKILNANISSAKKSVKRPVRRKQSKAPTQRKKTASTTASKISKGNVRGIFDSYAEDIISR